MLHIEFESLQVEAPPDVSCRDEAALKDWLWETHKDKIQASMTIRTGGSSAITASMNTPMRLQLLDTIGRVQRKFLLNERANVVFGCLLQELLNLMNSEYGFIGEMRTEPDGTLYLQTHAVTNIAWNAATRQFYEDNVQDGLKFYNLNTLFGKVMTSKQPVISNSPKTDKRSGGIPEGHPPLNRFLGIPFFNKDGEMNGMVGIANKAGAYTEDDIHFLEPFTATCSNLIQAYFHIHQNESLINTLEEKVQERTQKLQHANVRLEQANQQAIQSSAAQLQHFACANHEVRTPLSCIIGLSSLLLEETELTPMQRDSIRMIVNSGDLLLTVVNDILDYSKLETGNVDIEIRPSNLQDILQSVVHSIETKASRGVRIQTHYDLWLPEFVTTDGRRLQQILFNIMGNAIKFSKDNSTIDLTVSLVACESDDNDDDDDDGTQTCPSDHASSNHQKEELIGEEDCTTVSRCPFSRTTRVTSRSFEESSPSNTTTNCPFHRSNTKAATSSDASAAATILPARRHPNIRFQVKDYGKGIAKKDLERIFQPFQQASAETERVYGGTGLGLAITSKLVKALGGTIAVDSVLGEWTEFTIDLPFSDAQAKPTECDLLKDTKIILAAEEGCKEAQQAATILNENGVDWTHCKNLSSSPFPRFFSSLQQHTTDKPSAYLFLIHENLFESDSFRRIQKSTSQFSVITFGPNYSASAADMHFKSLKQVLPCVFVKSLEDHARKLNQRHCLPELGGDRDREGTACIESPTNKSLSSLDIRVLVAEDNRINQKVIVQMLRRLGIQRIDVADNGQMAVDMEASKEYDVVLMDNQMPILDGLEACRLITRRRKAPHRAPKIIFATAQVEAGFESECRLAGASGFLPKPFNLQAIAERLDKLALKKVAAPSSLDSASSPLNLTKLQDTTPGQKTTVIAPNLGIDASLPLTTKLEASTIGEFAPICRDETDKRSCVSSDGKYTTLIRNLTSSSTENQRDL